MDENLFQKVKCNFCFLNGEPDWVYTTHHVNNCSASNLDKLRLSQEFIASMNFVKHGSENQQQLGGGPLHKGIQPQGQTNPLCPRLGAVNPIMHPRLGSIKPIPSLFLRVSFGPQRFDVTLDGGATVSFITLTLALSLKLRILPNGELARLADKRITIQSKGEVDFCVVEISTGAALRVRALVMENLAVDCYGGTTFQLDNDVVPHIKTSTVYMHDFKYSVCLPPREPYRAYPPPSMQSSTPSVQTAPSAPKTIKQACPSEPSPVVTEPGSVCPGPKSVVMKAAKGLIPLGTYAIPVGNTSGDSPVLVLPPTPSPSDPPENCWPPQVCNVISGSAIYVNETKGALCHSKGAHFKVIPMSLGQSPSLQPPSQTVRLSAASSLPQPPPSKLLSKIKINVDLLTPQQLNRLHALHLKHVTAFNEDLREGFRDGESPYTASFSFKQEHKAPPFKVWAPQFNRQCSDLQQAMCDKLEAEGVLVDPAKGNIPVRHVSPSFITQKARAKHKPLEQCSLDEIRFITCCNVLNDSIHPIPGRSNTYTDIITFLARYKFHIFADLSNSYFQIKIAPNQLKYMGIMTPHRGIRVMDRLSQGLLNSDVHLDQVLGRVLGDEKAAGFCCVARDDIFVGGNTVDECLSNWEIVLAKLNAHNLKLSPSKVRILLQDSEVFGHRVVNGTIRPSDHIVSTLASTTVKNLVTVKQVNGWKGLYKTLLRHLPKLAHFMEPFDHACKSQLSSSTFDWTRPGLVAAFNAATAHLDQVTATYLPKPEEQLILFPDTSTDNLCAGWALYTRRATEEKQLPINSPTPPGEGFSWLPVQYMSGKLAAYMDTWSPCEQEGVGSVMAIDQGRHWINESRHPTWVLPDNKSVVDAANLMRIGRHSTNPRLQQLLASVNRSNVVFRHNSAKAGHHKVPDALSRVRTSKCTSKDCQIERFLEDLPQEVQFMPITLASLVLASSDPAILASSAPDMSRLLGPGSGPIPLGSRQTWIDLQSQCNLCSRFVTCKAQGQIPSSKARDKAGLNRLFKTCDLDRGLIVSKTFDSILMKEISRIFVPPDFLLAILTIMHVRLSHPLTSQLIKVFERYFIAFNTRNTCEAITEDCSLCSAVRRFPKELDNFTPSPSPEHPGTHTNADVMKRASQLVLVNTDRFSNFTTATLVNSEKREDLAEGLLQTITPIRHNSKVLVRTDRATGFVSLTTTPHHQLISNGIELDLKDHANPNSNASVDKIMQELEAELVRLAPEGRKIDTGILAQATTNLNNKVRQHGLSASQLHFARDQHTGKNLTIRDNRIRQVREERKDASSRHCPPPPAHIRPGQVVYVRREGDKHTARHPLLVTGVENSKVVANRILHSSSLQNAPPRITSRRVQLDPKFLYVPPHRRQAQQAAGERRDLPPQASQVPNLVNHEVRPAPKSPWHHSRPYSGDYYTDEEMDLRPSPPWNHHHPAQQILNMGGGNEERGEEGADPLPGAARGPRRGPPRERWVLRQDDQEAQQPPEPVGDQGLQQEGVQGQQAPEQIVLQEEVAAQVQGRGFTRGGRATKAPERYGMEKDRAKESEEALNISDTDIDRNLSPKGPSIASTPNISPMITPHVTPVTTPETSPDTSAVIFSGHEDWQLHRGRTSRERAENVLERHRHWSDPGPDVRPQHPRFQDWDPGPAGRGGAPKEL